MKTLAIIDDEEDLSEVLKLLIERMGDFKIETFTNAETFLHRSEAYSFDIVFSDLNLPGGVNGIQCLHQLCSSGKKPQRTVIMTGDSGFETKDPLIDCCLFKPFNYSILKDCLS